jgi:hypothetical protein
VGQYSGRLMLLGNQLTENRASFILQTISNEWLLHGLSAQADWRGLCLKERCGIVPPAGPNFLFQEQGVKLCSGTCSTLQNH